MTSIKPPIETTTNDIQSILDAWSANNSWILNNDPKSGYAKQQFAIYHGQGIDVKQAIIKMENDVRKSFPTVNTERDNQPFQEGGSRPGKKRGTTKLSMSDLNNDELKYYRQMPGAWKSEEAYLQAVQDTRNEK